MKIFVDMDQVLVDFVSGTEKLLGFEFESVNGDPFAVEERTKKVVFPSFWQELPPMPDYLDLWNFVSPFDPYILSAYPSWKDPYVFMGKRAWLRSYLRIPEDRVHIVH